MEWQARIAEPEPEKLRKPGCLGSYVLGHTQCDGPVGEDDACLLRDLCAALPTLGECAGFGAEKLVRDLSVEDLLQVYNGQANVAERCEQGRRWIQRVALPDPPKRKRYITKFCPESLRYYRFLVRQLKKTFGPNRVVPERIAAIDSTGILRVRAGENNRPVMGDFSLFYHSYYPKRQWITWWYQRRGLAGRKIFMVGPRVRPHGLDIWTIYPRYAIRERLGHRLYYQLKPSYIRLSVRKRWYRDMFSVVRGADRDKIRILVLFFRLLAEEGQLGRKKLIPRLRRILQ